jgi:hypothetical protein
VVPRKLSYFVGRLDPATAVESLREYLAESGIHDAECRKLTANMSSSDVYRNLFFDENCWLRAWNLETGILTQKGRVVLDLILLLSM